MGRQLSFDALVEDVALEPVSAADVHHDLTGVLERVLEDGDLFIGLARLHRRVADDGLAEDARRLGQRHRSVALEHGAIRQVQIVVCVAQLVGEGPEPIVRRLEVGEDAGFVVAKPHAEGAIPLAGSGLCIYPALLKGPPSKAGQPIGVGVEMIYDEGRRF